MWTKGHNSKIQKHRVMVLDTALLPLFYQPMKFHKISSYSLKELFSGQKMRKKGRNSKIKQHRVMVLGTALLLNEIYPHMKFHDNNSYTFQDNAQTKSDGRTSGHTD